MAEKYAVVAVHDVAPKNLNKIMKIDEFLRKQGIDDFSYLVIPRYHDSESQDIRLHEEFVEIMQGTGQELALHGLSHSNLLLEDEFFTNYKIAEARLKEGKKIFREAFGSSPTGFIPPMWLISRAAVDAVNDNGFKYTSSSNYFYDLRDGVKFRTTLVIRGNIMTVPSTFNTLFRRKPLVAVALHPHDTLPKTKLLKMLINYLKSKGYTFLSYKSLLEKL
jgi:predicted deacetylase